MGQSRSHQGASCAERAGGQGQEGGSDAGRDGPESAVLFPEGSDALSNLGSPTRAVPAKSLRPVTLSQPLPCFGARDLGTHVPQAEVTHWPVVRLLLPVPTGARWVQCPVVRLPAWGLPPRGLH